MPEQAAKELSDYETAEKMRDGSPSPQKFGDFWLFDLRITGTGAAWRDSISEYAYRHPDLWLSEEFVKRCNGLPVIFLHPEKSGLNSDEFHDRVVGTVILPYIRDQAVWGIAKIYDEAAVTLMTSSHRSTSPGVTPSKGSVVSTSDTGTKDLKVLAENLPFIMDHVAICERGVWDGSSENPPSGIRLDGLEEQTVADEDIEKLKKERDDAIKRADEAVRRADSAEAKEKEREDAAKRDAESLAGKELADKTKRDAEEKAKKDAEESERAAIEKSEKEKADKKMADRKSKHDAAKHDGSHSDCAKCDSEEMEADKRKDAGAATETVNANVEELKDAQRRHDADLKALQAEIAALKKQPTMDDANAIATAYHRYDSIYQMLGERVPQHMPGESPIAYRRRLADGLRKHTKTWKEHVLHDAVAGPAFDMIEQSIIDEALAEAKNPTRTDANAGRLIERTTVQNGKTRTEFYGDSSVAFAPFEAPVMSFKFKKPSKAA